MEKKVAVITGASRGIGKAIAMKFAEAGYRLAICSMRSPEALTETAQALRSMGADCVTFTGNMGCYEDVCTFFALIQQSYGRLDILIHNAGRSYIGLLQDMSPEEWHDLLNTNLSSAFYLTKLAIPMMLAQGSGKILSISSVWGLVGASTEVAYSATKGGLNAFTKALAKELAPSNIQVNAIACGAIETSMNHFLTEEESNALLEEIPTGRMGTPEEVAELALLLCEKNAYLTGQIISLDGGWI